MPALVRCDICMLTAACVLQSFLPVPYFASERSFAQFRIPEEMRTIVGFGSQANTLLIISANGTFCTATFDTERGGPCERGSHNRFIEVEAREDRT